MQGLTKSLADMSENKRQKLTDECVGYGSYVAECLAKLDARTRCITQHQMNTVLF